MKTKTAPVRGKSAGGRRRTRTTRKTSRRPVTAVPPNPGALQWANDRWNALEQHHQQRILSILLLILSLTPFSALTVFQAVPILSSINRVLLVFFGWSAYVLAAGLIALAVARLIEAMRRKSFLRTSLVIGLILLFLLLLAESALIVGSMSIVGVLGEVLILPLLSWPRGIDHVVVLGLLLISVIMTFRLRFGHVLLVAGYIQRLSPPSVPMSTDEVSPSNDMFEGQTLSLADPLPHVGQTSHPGIIVKLPPAVNEMEPLVPNPHLAQNGMPARPAKSRTKQYGTSNVSSQSRWKLPGTSLLKSPNTPQRTVQDPGELAKIVQSTLRSLRIEAEVRPTDISIGPTVIRIGIRPTGKPEMRKDEKTGKMEVVTDASGNIVYATRTRVSRILAVQNDLALALSADSIRMEAPVPGRPYVGLELPNKSSRLVTLREVLETSEYRAAQAKSLLSIGLGRDVTGQVRVANLAAMPHLLIAGATGSGKSVMLNTIIASILTQATPDDVRLLMVDPKMVELNMYNGIPHLLQPVVTEVDQVVPLLGNAIKEMERRYRLFSALGVRNLDGYRKLRREKDSSLEALPAIVIIIDELADLMMAAADEVEKLICRLAQLARATGIHLILATQRPSVDVITGLIKANIPTRISFMVSSATDSRTIIDMGGAERLLGRGDMLYLPAEAGRPERIQGAFLGDDEAQVLADFWRHQSFTK